MLPGNAGPLQASNWHSVPLGAIGPRRLGARAQARAGPALLVSRKHLQVLESITANPGPPPPPPPPPPPLQRKAPAFLTVPGPGLGCCEQCKVACPCPGACPVRPPLRGRSRVSSRDLKPGRPRRSGEPESSLMCALALLLLIRLESAAGDAPDPCASLRAQNTELAAQLLARDAELSRLRSELAAARSTAEACKKGRTIGTGAARGLETDGGLQESNRRREGCTSAKAPTPPTPFARSSWH
jgi:hypothetical protein